MGCRGGGSGGTGGTGAKGGRGEEDVSLVNTDSLCGAKSVCRPAPPSVEWGARSLVNMAYHPIPPQSLPGAPLPTTPTSLAGPSSTPTPHLKSRRCLHEHLRAPTEGEIVCSGKDVNAMRHIPLPPHTLLVGR